MSKQQQQPSPHHPSEEAYVEAIFELVHYIYLRDARVRHSEHELELCGLEGIKPTTEQINENLALKAEAIKAYLKQIKEESNIQ